ncbi:MAG: excinuclease ABC subunit UvrA [Planctomycetaceae bacterium]|nr:excinuclease ABC subunit UvrA [Planctomycetaceae bacterium]
MTIGRFIELEGVRVNNLRNISLKIRHNALTVICGVSGSGKSSLAFDTLYAEGQRRGVETFSPSARQWLDRVERPEADRIIGLPPAIAIRQQMRFDGPRNTLGSRTEIIESLRVLFARAGCLVCPDCERAVQAASADAVATTIAEDPAPHRIMIGAEMDVEHGSYPDVRADLMQLGFTRVVLTGSTMRLEELDTLPPVVSPGGKKSRTLPKVTLTVIIDRLKSDTVRVDRLTESISTAMKIGDGRCVVLTEFEPAATNLRSNLGCEVQDVDGKPWSVRRFSGRRICSGCSREFPEPSPELLSFTSPLGACPDCGGTGTAKSGAENLSGRPRRGEKTIPTSGRICAACNGSRLNRDALAVQMRGLTLPALTDMEVGELSVWLAETRTSLPEELSSALRPVFEHACRRLRFLDECGMSYLALSRSMRTLSGGESQRASLTTALGSGLINTLYVLDEPTAGLHPSETQQIITAVRELQQRGNTVVVVEHDLEFIAAADDIVEIGPGAGDAGGRIVFHGSPREHKAADTATGKQLRQAVASGSLANQGAETANGDATAAESGQRKMHREPEQWLTLKGVRCHNISHLSVAIPLGVLCAITGVSGSGKSSLIVDALYPELCRRLQIPCELGGDGIIEAVEGVEQLDNVLLLDRSPVKRSQRSIPATWLGVFDEIRMLLADTHEAKKRNFGRGMFSFNSASGGRCPVCEGRGIVTVAMQFLADIQTTCEECGGRRFRPEVLEIRYRDRTVHEILCMTGDESFTFFNGHHKIQQRLNALRQAGLGYLRLGQPLSTVSGGEAQRLRIAALLAGIPMDDGETAAQNRKAAGLTRGGRTLFLLDEPCSGLHLQDIERLRTCLEFLVQTGHSVIVIEHDPALTSHADHMIQMGPASGRFGGRIVN